jgi:uncharacterized protein YciI
MIKFVILMILVTLGAAALVHAEENTLTMRDGDSTITMKKYFLCLLKTGPNRDQDSATAAQIQAGHLAHIDAMAKAGQVAIAGPMGDDGDLRGILVFTVSSKEEAEKLEAEDPAVKAGRLIMEVHPWWAMKGSRLP